MLERNGLNVKIANYFILQQWDHFWPWWEQFHRAASDTNLAVKNGRWESGSRKCTQVFLIVYMERSRER
jgi:hypothetical protein